MNGYDGLGLIWWEMQKLKDKVEEVELEWGAVSTDDPFRQTIIRPVPVDVYH